MRQVHLKKNHGRMRATHIGVLHAQYSIIATMDDDLQCDPLDLIDMVDRLVREKNYPWFWRSSAAPPRAKSCKKYKCCAMVV